MSLFGPFEDSGLFVYGILRVFQVVTFLVVTFANIVSYDFFGFLGFRV